MTLAARARMALATAAALVMATLCGACQSGGASLKASPPAVDVQVVTAAPVPPDPTPACQPASGVSLEVHRPGYGGPIELQAKGLVPGEKPVVFYTAQNGTEELREEDSPDAQGADSQGNYFVRLYGLELLPGDITTTWDVRLVHLRGVACVEITVPW